MAKKIKRTSTETRTSTRRVVKKTPTGISEQAHDFEIDQTDIDAIAKQSLERAREILPEPSEPVDEETKTESSGQYPTDSPEYEAPSNMADEPTPQATSTEDININELDERGIERLFNGYRNLIEKNDTDVEMGQMYQDTDAVLGTDDATSEEQYNTGSEDAGEVDEFKINMADEESKDGGSEEPMGELGEWKEEDRPYTAKNELSELKKEYKALLESVNPDFPDIDPITKQKITGLGKLAIVGNALQKGTSAKIGLAQGLIALKAMRAKDKETIDGLRNKSAEFDVYKQENDPKLKAYDNCLGENVQFGEQNRELAGKLTKLENILKPLSADRSQLTGIELLRELNAALPEDSSAREDMERAIATITGEITSLEVYRDEESYSKENFAWLNLPIPDDVAPADILTNIYNNLPDLKEFSTLKAHLSKYMSAAEAAFEKAEELTRGLEENLGAANSALIKYEKTTIPKLEGELRDANLDITRLGDELGRRDIFIDKQEGEIEYFTGIEKELDIEIINHNLKIKHIGDLEIGLKKAKLQLKQIVDWVNKDYSSITDEKERMRIFVEDAPAEVKDIASQYVDLKKVFDSTGKANDKKAAQIKAFETLATKVQNWTKGELGADVPKLNSENVVLDSAASKINDAMKTVYTRLDRVCTNLQKQRDEANLKVEKIVDWENGDYSSAGVGVPKILAIANAAPELCTKISEYLNTSATTIQTSSKELKDNLQEAGQAKLNAQEALTTYQETHSHRDVDYDTTQKLAETIPGLEENLRKQKIELGNSIANGALLRSQLTEKTMHLNTCLALVETSASMVETLQSGISEQSRELTSLRDDIRLAGKNYNVVAAELKGIKDRFNKEYVAEGANLIAEIYHTIPSDPGFENMKSAVYDLLESVKDKVLVRKSALDGLEKEIAECKRTVAGRDAEMQVTLQSLDGLREQLDKREAYIKTMSEHGDHLNRASALLKQAHEQGGTINVIRQIRQDIGELAMPAPPAVVAPAEAPEPEAPFVIIEAVMPEPEHEGIAQHPLTELETRYGCDFIH